MKKLLTMATLLLPIALAGCSHPHPAHYYPPPPQPLAGAEVAQQGYHDGVNATQRASLVEKTLYVAVGRRRV